MKAVIQRVLSAQVNINNKIHSSINNGYVVLLGIGYQDTKDIARKIAEKIAHMRILSDKNGKLNKSIVDLKQEILVVSQFTLLANTNFGRRPSFILAMKPDKAKKLYLEFIRYLREFNIIVKTGVFGSYMHVSFVNDGPVTIILELGEKRICSCTKKPQ